MSEPAIGEVCVCVLFVSHTVLISRGQIAIPVGHQGVDLTPFFLIMIIIIIIMIILIIVINIIAMIMIIIMMMIIIFVTPG